MLLYIFVVFFFFSSRRRHTRSLCDWSSDVCSSDLRLFHGGGRRSTLPRVRCEPEPREALCDRLPAHRRRRAPPLGPEPTPGDSAGRPLFRSRRPPPDSRGYCIPVSPPSVGRRVASFHPFPDRRFRRH